MADRMDVIETIIRASKERHYRRASPALEAGCVTGALVPLFVLLFAFGPFMPPAMLITLASLMVAVSAFMWLRLMRTLWRFEPQWEGLDELLDAASTAQLLELTEAKDKDLRVSVRNHLRGKLLSLDRNKNPGLSRRHYRIVAQALGTNDLALAMAILDAVPTLCDTCLMPPLDRLAEGPEGTSTESGLRAAGTAARERLRRRLRDLGTDLLRPSQSAGDIGCLVKPAQDENGHLLRDRLRPTEHPVPTIGAARHLTVGSDGPCSEVVVYSNRAET